MSAEDDAIAAEIRATVGNELVDKLLVAGEFKRALKDFFAVAEQREDRLGDDQDQPL